MSNKQGTKLVSAKYKENLPLMLYHIENAATKVESIVDPDETSYAAALSPIMMLANSTSLGVNQDRIRSVACLLLSETLYEVLTSIAHIS